MFILPETGDGDLICKVVNLNRWINTTLDDDDEFAHLQYQFMMQSKREGIKVFI